MNSDGTPMTVNIDVGRVWKDHFGSYHNSGDDKEMSANVFVFKSVWNDKIWRYSYEVLDNGDPIFYKAKGEGNCRTHKWINLLSIVGKYACIVAKRNFRVAEDLIVGEQSSSRLARMCR